MNAASFDARWYLTAGSSNDSFSVGKQLGFDNSIIG